MCIYPRLIRNKRYIANKKNGGVIPPLPMYKGKVDQRVLAVAVGCGNCMECMKQKARDWQVRLTEEIKEKKKGYFVTLTFSNESIEEIGKELWKLKGYEKDNAIAKIGVRRFLERWRKKYKKSVRHWIVTELGDKGTENVHMHGIIWTEHEVEEIERIWRYGYVYIGEYVNEKTVNYIVKYIYKRNEKYTEYKAKVLTSAGIGAGYMKRLDAIKNKYKEGKTKETYKTRTGIKLGLPKYYRNKIYKEEEKEKLWLEKLDKEERYVDGQKINIKEGLEEYYNVVETAREKNKRLGYGTNVKQWSREVYENERRDIMYEKRIKGTR